LESYDAPKGARRVREGGAGNVITTVWMWITRADSLLHARARRPQSRSEATPELLFLSSRGKVEAWKRRPEPPVLEPEESSDLIFLHKSLDPITLLFRGHKIVLLQALRHIVDK
jgi:hypothetical protein